MFYLHGIELAWYPWRNGKKFYIERRRVHGGWQLSNQVAEHKVA